MSLSSLEKLQMPYSGKSLTVKLKEKPRPTSAKFRACIVLTTESEFGTAIDLECRITSQGEDICGSHQFFEGPIFSEHLYLFDVQGKDITSTELEFVFELHTFGSGNNIWIKECGIRQLSELQTKTSETGEC
uniref:Uncharacterized protein n=1 Tax=Noccaea caerulescens TaxID=107243 RepID=A0A1J3C780_NOCCA